MEGSPVVKPFSRPSVGLSVPDVARSWQTIPAQQIAPGDTLPGVGKVMTVNRVVIVRAESDTHAVHVAGGADNEVFLPVDEPVRVFAPAPTA